MEVLIAVVVSALFAALCKKPLKKYPWIFYLLAVAIVGVFLSHVLLTAFPVAGRVLYPYIQRCLFAFGLFCIVMFIGALSDKSRIKKYFMPIRGELSIIASILTMGHVINYLGSYLDRLISGFAGATATMILSFAVSAVLLIALIPLAVTSFNGVRRKMSPAAWKRLQLCAYPFFILIYVHLLLILSASGPKGFISIAVYTVIFGTYIILRIRRAILDKKAASTCHNSERTLNPEG